ncbi:MAG: ABC transporter ATP-binding protein [Hyphomonadaceae bacterium]|nr:ABC transporter ATP-binding protein [Hyphomonadaceae bacterium]
MSAALRVAGLSKSYGGKQAVDRLGFEVRRGEMYALLGPNGAGKTTTLRMISGLLAADAGEIRVFDVDARADPIAAKQLIAWLPDEPLLYDKLTAWEYLEFVAGLWGVDAKSAAAQAEDLLKLLGLWDNRNDRCESFSRGMKQKAVLAGALIHDPKLLMLDEPLTGLDAAASRLVKDLIRRKVSEGCAVILTTHILEVAERMADRIGIIKDGRLLVEGSLGELQSRAGSAGQSLEDVFLQLTATPEAAEKASA